MSIMDNQAISSAIAKFSARFCHELEKNVSVVSSPLSAEFVLALLTLGTSEPAHTELLACLGIPNDESIRSTFTNISLKLKSLKGVSFSVANKVYVAHGDYDLHPELKIDAVNVFDSDLEKVNFVDRAQAVDTINKWVESKTNDKIKDLLTEDSVSGDTRLVLVNALHFKGTWKKQFNPIHTVNQPFHLNNNFSKEVPMMYLEDKFRYVESEKLKAQLLEMDYIGGQAKMLIILPTEYEGLNGLLKKLAEGFDLTAELKRMYSRKVKVTVPKFKIETSIDLKEVLPKLGIRAIFDAVNSGLTRVLNKPEPLFVSHAVQKAFIEVNEEGAEAAAATAISVVAFSAVIAQEEVPTFTADYPFLAVVFFDDVPVFFANYKGN